MPPANSSGYSLTQSDAELVIGMQARGDRNHDIAAWFGVNQGRIKEAKDGRYGTLVAAPANMLPPKGPPGIKGRRARDAIEKALATLSAGQSVNKAALTALLTTAAAEYDANEP